MRNVGLAASVGVRVFDTVIQQYGGKTSIASWIVGHFPAHRVYLEPFCGGASVLFAKPRSHIEIINDMDKEIIHAFDVMRRNPDALAAALWATPYSPTVFDTLTESDIDMAVKAIAESKQVYSGNRNSSTWAIDKCAAAHKPKPAVWADWFKRIRPAAERLRGVTRLCEDALKAMERVYMDPEALLYVDPPYLGHEDEYKFSVDYGKMVALLREAKASVCVSEYPEAAHHFEGWAVATKETAGRARTGAHNTKAKVKTEMLFMNYDMGGLFS